MTTQELTKEVSELNKQSALTAESCKLAHERLDAVEAEQKENSRILVVIERLSNGISNLGEKVEGVDKKVDGLGNRITAIEQEPAGKWKQFSWSVFMIVVGALATYILTQIGLKP